MEKKKPTPTPVTPVQVANALFEMLDTLHTATGGGSPVSLLNIALSVVLYRIIEDGCNPEDLKELCTSRVNLIVESRAKIENDKPRIIVPGERDVKH